MKDKKEIAISVQNATVRFNMASERIDNLKEYMVKAIKRELRFKEFLALQNVSLEIRRGEAWGLLGRNGAGKSTLLKLICGILTPYQGTVSHNGSIAPLIELGAGFDSNLTAEENVYLNGALLGYKKKFMREHYDEIVDFAELHKFMNIPVKNYSSGMRARLGFAIATVVCPDILVVDEVLAVGDASFQKKCQNRMSEMLSSGVTLVFVSHSIGAVQSLCDHALWLEKGVERMSGDVDEVCNAYKDFITEKPTNAMVKKA